MEKFGLSQRSIDLIHQILARYPEVELAVIYGSRAKGNYREGSDIDLTLFGNALTHQIVGKIAGDLDDSYSPYLFDLSIFEQLNSESLKDHIRRVGKVFYQRKNSNLHFEDILTAQ